MIDINKKDEFQNRKNAFEEEKNKYEKMHSSISAWRAVFFLAGLWLVIIGITDDKDVALVFGVLFFIVFAALVKKHISVERDTEIVKSKFEVTDRYVKRFNDDWRGFTNDGSEFLTGKDYVSNDIDLLGPNSLYQMINVCHTTEGAKKLSDELLGEYPDVNSLKERQKAILELVENDDFAVDFEAAGVRLEKTKNKLKSQNLDVLSASNDSYDVPKWFQLIRFIIPIAEIALIILSICGVFSYIIPVIAFMVILIFTWFTKGVTDQYILPFYMIGVGALSYLDIFNMVKKANFKSSVFKKMTEEIAGENGCIKAFSKLRMIKEGYNILYNPLLHQLASGLLLWDFQLACIVSKWKRMYGDNIVRGFDYIGDIEELLSLAVLGRVRKTTFAEIYNNESDLKSHIEFDNLFHPLINPEKVVSNSASFDGGVTIVTGSNMSGKTTFLRTVAVNLVLAYLGAPICGERLKANTMKIFTSMRVTDDVANGISTFYAEILRIKAMAEYKEKNEPMLCLIDEIFKGTNSADRIVGATEAITRLSSDKCITMVSTHDFELCDIKDKNGKSAVNYHFEEYYENDELKFDYKIRDGRCTTTNARAILKMAGFDVPI